MVAGLTVGSIVLNELRQSRNVDDAINAFYAAESGIEQAVYLYRKDNSTFVSQIEEIPSGDPPPSSPDDCYFAMGNFGNRDCTAYWQDSPATTFTLNPGNVHQLNMFNEVLATGYGIESIEITWSDNNPNNGIEPWLEIEYQELRADFDNSDTQVFVQTCDNAVGVSTCTAVDSSTYSIASNFPSASRNYKVRFRALYDTITATVVAYDSGGGSGNVVGSRTVDIFTTGEYRTAAQSLRAQVSTGVTTTKAFADFVLFSDCDITKGYGGSAPCPN